MAQARHSGKLELVQIKAAASQKIAELSQWPCHWSISKQVDENATDRIYAGDNPALFSELLIQEHALQVAVIASCRAASTIWPTATRLPWHAELALCIGQSYSVLYMSRSALNLLPSSVLAEKLYDSALKDNLCQHKVVDEDHGW